MTDNDNNQSGNTDAQESKDTESAINNQVGGGDFKENTKKLEEKDVKVTVSESGDAVQNQNISEKNEEKQTSDEESAGEEDTPKKVSLFEAPVVIEGKRDRRKTERLTEILDRQQQESLEKLKKFAVPEGKGTPLKDIPYINHAISYKLLSEDLNLLHRLFFNSVGTSSVRRANIKRFCGFDFEDGSSEYEKKMDFLTRIFNQHMKKYILYPLGLKAGKTREETAKLVMDYVMVPKDRGLDPETLKKKKKGKKRSSSTSKKPKTDKSKKTSKKKDTTKEESDDSSSSDDSSDEEEEEKSEETPKKKKVKKDTPEKKTPKTTPKKKETKSAKKKTPKAKDNTKSPKKKTPKKQTKKGEDLSSLSPDSSDSDDEPLVKKVKKLQPPTDDQLRDVVKRILDSSDLEDLSIRKVFLQVSAMYPDFDMSERQKFIKKTVKELIN